jgi:hypothetical protein
VGWARKQARSNLQPLRSEKIAGCNARDLILTTSCHRNAQWLAREEPRQIYNSTQQEKVTFVDVAGIEAVKS